MPKCELSGLCPTAENLVSHSNIKTKSRAFPNIQKKSFYSPGLKKNLTVRISTRTIRHIDKLGNIDVYMLKQKNEKLSPKALKWKTQLLNKINKKTVKNQVTINEIKN